MNKLNLSPLFINGCEKMIKSKDRSFPISKFSISIFLIDAFLILSMIPFSVQDISEFVNDCRMGHISLGCLITPFFTLFGIVAMIFILFCDMPFARFWVTESGITEKMGFRRYHHSWDEFQDYGIIGLTANSIMGIKEVGKTYWVYLSATPLTQKEKNQFLRRTRRDLKRIAFFQYNKEVLQKVLLSMPKPMAEALSEQASAVEEQLNFWEKVYNK